MNELTSRQRQVLEFIREELTASGMPPTVAEIAAAMGVSSTNGIRGHLQALERKGAIELVPNASRGIRLLDQTESELQRNGLPIVGQVAAGSPILAQQHIEDYCRVDDDTFHPAADYLLRVKGESMREVGIYDGDLLAVHRASTANNGQIVVVRIEDEVTVKRLHVKGHIAYLNPENADFNVIKINMKEQALDIEGIAVGVLRHL
ncbi:MAG: transcriptional repressor LexA [Gammaproteobacteria bacterium]|nr:transcriptional repressor LexA [Gammaproteobacteria bacterium]